MYIYIYDIIHDFFEFIFNFRFSSSEVSGFQVFECVLVPFDCPLPSPPSFKMIQDFDEFKDEHPWGSGNKMANIG